MPIPAMGFHDLLHCLGAEHEREIEELRKELGNLKARVLEESDSRQPAIFANADIVSKPPAHPAVAASSALGKCATPPLGDSSPPATPVARIAVAELTTPIASPTYPEAHATAAQHLEDTAEFAASMEIPVGEAARSTFSLSPERLALLETMEGGSWQRVDHSRDYPTTVEKFLNHVQISPLPDEAALAAAFAVSEDERIYQEFAVSSTRSRNRSSRLRKTPNHQMPPPTPSFMFTGSGHQWQPLGDGIAPTPRCTARSSVTAEAPAEIVQKLEALKSGRHASRSPRCLVSLQRHASYPDCGTQSQRTETRSARSLSVPSRMPQVRAVSLPGGRVLSERTKALV